MIRPVILANFLVKKGNKYLLVQEATDKVFGNINTHSKGKWTFPHGEVDKDENIKEAAIRELMEETGGKTRLIRLGAIAQCFLNNTVCLLSFVFYGQDFKISGDKWNHEIKTIKWFDRKEIADLEKQGLIRDAAPLTKIIDSVEKNCGVEFIEWIQPDYVLKIFQLLNQGELTKKSRN